jgi:hypothetical protein
MAGGQRILIISKNKTIMDTNTKTFLDYMEHTEGGSITYVAERITQEYEQEHDVIEDNTARRVLSVVDKLISTHAQGGSIAFEMGTKVNMHMVQRDPLTTWLQRFSGMQEVS